ncbi:penicillin-binding protein 1C, partial [Thioalkalicoccus limnaeus]
RRVRAPHQASTTTIAAPEIAYPPDGAQIALGLDRATPAALPLKVRNGLPPFIWYVDGAAVARSPYGRPADWHPTSPGFATIAVVDARGRASRVRVLLEP